MLAPRMCPHLPRSPKGLWKNHRLPVIAGGALLVALVGGLIAYTALKRPGDVHNTGAFSTTEATPQRAVVDWTTYGLNNQRTRFLPVHRLKPPFKQRWNYREGTLTEFSPVIANGVLYGINNAGNAFALDAKSGKVKWKRKVATLSASSPAYHDGKVFITNLVPGQVVALNAANGKELWKTSLPGRSESSPVSAGRQGDLRLRVRRPLRAKRADRQGRLERHLAGRAQGRAGDRPGGSVSSATTTERSPAVHVYDGTIKWQSSSSGLSLGRTGAFYSTPAVAFGRVYIGSKDSRMYSFDEATGKLAWSHSTGDRGLRGAGGRRRPRTPPSVYFGGLDGTVYALDARPARSAGPRRPAGP